jgi:uncharacterized protein
MLIKDNVYGDLSIDDELYLELINSKPLQRLKKIGMHGLPSEYYYRPTFNRYDHSVGVFLMLSKFNASREERIAGLLHDVSHTAFSHVGDWLFKSKENQGYQDSILEEFMYKSEIPEILKKHDLTISKISEIEKYSLLEKNAPDLCADRLDYTLKEIYYRGFEDHAKKMFNDLKENNNQFVFKNFNSALLFSKYYMQFENDHWSSEENCLRYFLMTDMLKYALEEKLISKEDLFEDDYFILDKLKDLKHKRGRHIYQKIPFLLKYKIDLENPQYSVNTKHRFVDPLFLEKDKLKRLSEESIKFKNILTKEKARKKKGIHFTFLDDI